MIEDWFRGILTDGILSNLSGLFDSVNTEVGEIATQVGTTPAGWNAGIFNMIRSLSENVIVPIAGVIITFRSVYKELHADRETGCSQQTALCSRLGA
ncbi:VirB6/TrbL-like conjugal transfer protein, CD1112 family [Blautia sp. HCP3S3_D9]|uniref:VirB6/TrbL-like conjugal transfer protein, CD1112 family n=2 Tax=unclassified Blautia TaxID=2648079 RepID=UPI003F8B083E